MAILGVPGTAPGPRESCNNVTLEWPSPVGRRGNCNPSLVMTKGETMIHYGTNETWRWHPDTEEVRFTVLDDISNRKIKCRVTRECIADHCGNPSGSDACFTAAKEHFDVITDQVGRYIGLGRFEPDGSILLRTNDWRLT